MGSIHVSTYLRCWFDFVWLLADTLNGLMAIPNLIALLLLSWLFFHILVTLKCLSFADYTYYVAPGTFCRELHRVYLPYGKLAPVERFKCAPGTVMDITLCRCNHWFFTRIRSDCKSDWDKWAYSDN